MMGVKQRLRRLFRPVSRSVNRRMGAVDLDQLDILETGTLQPRGRSRSRLRT